MDVSGIRIANDLDPGVGAGKPTASSGAAQRRRQAFGRMGADVRRFPEQSSVQVEVGTNEIALLTPLVGRVEWVDEALAALARTTLTPGSGALLGRAGVTTLVGMAGASSLLLHLPRDEFQVLISRRRNQPTRLAAVDLVVATPPALLEVCSHLARTLSNETESGEAAKSELCSRLEAALSAAFLGEVSWGAMLQTPRAVSRAIAAIREGSALDPEALAAASGVTSRTLREGFVAMLGVSLTAYLQQARLDRARQSLASGYDSRAIPKVAKDSGFSTASAFSRAYVRAFGEAPTETRARAVRAAPPATWRRSALG